MQRRQVLAMLGSSAAFWPLEIRAQQSPERVRRIGLLLVDAGDDPEAQANLVSFEDELLKRGWIEGKNIRIDVRFAAGEGARYPAYAKELVALAPDILVAGGTT